MRVPTLKEPEMPLESRQSQEFGANTLQRWRHDDRRRPPSALASPPSTRNSISWKSTHQEEEPSCLGIVDPWDFVELNLLFPALLLQEIAHIFGLANRHSQDFQPLLGVEQLWISFPHHGIWFHTSGSLGEFLNTLWHHSSPVPDLCLPVMHADVGVGKELFLNVAILAQAISAQTRVLFISHREGRRGSHTTARELQTCTFQGPGASKHHQNSTRRPPERHRNSETVAGKGRKSAKFWAPHPSGHHPSGPHPSGPHPFGAPPFRGPTLRGPTLRGPTLRGPTLRGPTFSRFGPPTHRGLHPSGPHLLGGAQRGGDPMGKTLKHQNWPKSVWPKSVNTLKH